MFRNVIIHLQVRLNNLMVITVVTANLVDTLLNLLFKRENIQHLKIGKQTLH